RNIHVIVLGAVHEYRLRALSQADGGSYSRVRRRVFGDRIVSKIGDIHLGSVGNECGMRRPKPGLKDTETGISGDVNAAGGADVSSAVSAHGGHEVDCCRIRGSPRDYLCHRTINIAATCFDNTESS